MSNKYGQSLLLSTALAAWLALAGHAFAAPAPVVNMGLKSGPPSGIITVRKGETLRGIAIRYRVSSDAVVAANGLKAPYTLHAGQRLRLPPPSWHKVGDSDTLYSVSRMYGVPLEKLADANRLKPPYVLKVGTTLRIPGGSAPVEKSAPPEQTAAKGHLLGSYTVRTAKGGPPHLLRAPGPSPEHKAFSSMVTRLTGDGEAAKPRPVSALMPAAPAQSSAPVIVGQSDRAGFIWPVRGQVVSSYGPKDGGLYNDGINIAAPRGTPVKAAADGVVVYVGNTLESYGNLLLIRHPGGMVTAYAHMQSVKVRPGDRVSRGDVVGSVGSTGAVSTAQLHFEVRRGTDTFDPKRYLG